MEEDGINLDYLMGGWDINRWVVVVVVVVVV